MTGTHILYGSPIKPSWQEQNTLWWRTSHKAALPQGRPFLHGSTHLLFIHPLLFGQSELPIHSGLQYGGLPI